MTTSNKTKDKSIKEAYVWIYLPNKTKPVVAGKLELDNDTILFNYGKSYLERINDQDPAIPIYEPELPLKTGQLPLLEGLVLPGCIRDAAPDAWGRRVIINKKLGLKGTNTDTAELIFLKLQELQQLCCLPYVRLHKRCRLRGHCIVSFHSDVH